MNFLRRLLDLFDRCERWKLAALSLVLFFGSLLEVAGIGIILPFIKIVGTPMAVLNDPRFGPWLSRIGVETPRAVTTMACGALLVLSLFKGAYVAFSMRAAYRFIYNKSLSLTKQLLLNYLHAPYLFHVHKNTADLVRTTTFETEAVGSVLKFVLFLPVEIIVVCGVVVVLIATEPGTALIGITALGTLMWAVSAYSRKELSRLGKVRSEQHSKMIQWVNQSLGGIKEVKLLGRDQFFCDALARGGRQYTNALCRSTLIMQYPRVILETSAALLIVLFVLLVMFSGRDMKSVVGVLALFGMATVRLVPSATRIMNALQTMRLYAYSLTSVAQGLRVGQGVESLLHTGRQIEFKTCIRLENLAYRYPDNPIDALSEITLEIPRGARIAFVGSSGAGKTTLANLVLGLLEPTAGQIMVDGVDIRENVRGWQQRLGYIPQDIYLIDDTIRRNIAFGIPDGTIDDAVIWRALESAQLSTFVRELPARLDTQVGERGVRISAGQRQRIGIARALYHDPDVLVLDEATSALDNETERQFAAAINNLSRSKTVLIIAHRLTTVRHCDVIFVLDSARLVGAGTYDELQATNPVFSQLVRSSQSLVTA